MCCLQSTLPSIWLAPDLLPPSKWSIRFMLFVTQCSSIWLSFQFGNRLPCSLVALFEQFFENLFFTRLLTCFEWLYVELIWMPVKANCATNQTSTTRWEYKAMSIKSNCIAVKFRRVEIRCDLCPPPDVQSYQIGPRHNSFAMLFISRFYAF